MASNPAPFSLTVDEATLVQGEQARRQTTFAQEGASLKLLSLAVPAVSIGLLIAIDKFLFAGAMPVGFYVGLTIAYLMGLFVQLAVMMSSMAETKRRMLAATPQVWEERTIRLEADGLAQDTPSSQALFRWGGIQSVARDDTFIWFWLTEFNAVAVPLRAFASSEDAVAFEAEGLRRVAAEV